VKFEELGELSIHDWVELTGREPEPFGHTTAALVFRPKDHHIAMRGEDGRLLAAAGATIATISVGDVSFEVVGLGALIVRPDVRGRGLSLPLRLELRKLALRLGPDRAMLFCEPPQLPLLRAADYRLLETVVRVDQPEGRVEMPLPAMWRPMRPAGWPPGEVDVDGLPF
jgi:hypothetical protein